MRVKIGLALLLAGSLALAAGPSEGDNVVVRIGDQFLSAEVVSADADPAKVKLTIEPSEEVQVALGDMIARPDEEHPAHPKKGDWLLIDCQGFWVVQKFKGTEEGKAKTTTVAGKDDEAGPLEFLVPPKDWIPVLEKWWNSSGDLSDVASVSAPEGTGAEFSVGDRVIFRGGATKATESWYGGIVRAAKGDGYLVADISGSEASENTHEVDAAHIAPAPKEDKALPVKKGDLVYFAYHHFANYVPWIPSRVGAVRGKSVLLIDEDGRSWVATPGEYIRAARKEK